MQLLYGPYPAVSNRNASLWGATMRPKDEPSIMPDQSNPAKRLIVYVDGFNLYNGLKDGFGKRYLWLDLVKLVSELRPDSDLVHVKYFTSPVEGRSETKQRQLHYQYAMKSLNRNRVRITQGRHESREVECLSCRKTWQHYEEKETDVNIAVNIVQDAYSDAADDFIIISGDTDLIPAIKMAQSVKKDLFVAAAFPPERFSKMLKRLMPSSFIISENKFRAAQLPDSFVDNLDQRTYSRPPGWK
jgi:uncharacterized LabA/DUF88 family protein